MCNEPQIELLESPVKRELDRLCAALKATAPGVERDHTRFDYVGPDNRLRHDTANCPRCRYKAARIALIDWMQEQRIERQHFGRWPFKDLDRAAKLAAIRQAERTLKEHPRR